MPPARGQRSEGNTTAAPAWPRNRPTSTRRTVTSPSPSGPFGPQSAGTGRAVPQRIDSSTCGGFCSVSFLPRRAGLAVAVVAAAIGLNLAAPRADAAVPETIVRETSQPGRRRRARAARCASASRASPRSSVAPTRATAPSSAARPSSRSTATTATPTTVVAVLPLASYSRLRRLRAHRPAVGGRARRAGLRRPTSVTRSSRSPRVWSPRSRTPAPTACAPIVTLPDGTEVWYCHQNDVSVYTGQAVDVADPDRHRRLDRQLHRPAPAPRGAPRRRQPHRPDGLAARRPGSPPEDQRLRFSRGFCLITIGVPTKPNSSRSRRSMKRS